MASLPSASHKKDDPTLASIACAPYKLGWAFLLAWVFCVFYLGTTGASTPDAAKDSTISQIVLKGLPVFSSVATLAAALALEKRFGSPSRHKAVVYGAPTIAALGTPLLHMQVASAETSCLAFCVAAVLTGAGSGVMWISWGEYYADIPQDEREIAAPASAAVAALLVLASSSMSGWVNMAFVASMPVISGACLLWAMRENGCLLFENRDANNREASACRPARNGMEHTRCARAAGGIASMGRTLPGIFIACIFVCLAGGFAEGANAVSTTATQSIMLGAFLFTAALTGAAIAGPRRISLSFFYRWMCPALVAGFGAVVLFPGSFGTCMALAASIAARFSFCLITQMFFANLAESGKVTATQAFGWGWIAVHLGDFLGVVVLVVLATPASQNLLAPDVVAVASIIALVVATMFVLDDTKSFRSDCPDNEADAADEFCTHDESEAEEPSGQPCACASQKRPSNAGGRQPGGCIADSDEKPADGGAGESENGTEGCADDAATESSAMLSAGEDAAKEDGASEALPSFEEAVFAIARNARLTPRETEVFGLLARGRSIPYIRDELVISRETAATHAKHIYAKLDVHSRQELIDLVAREA